MNPIEELVNNFQSLVAQVPEIVQPFIVMVAGAIPFLDGEVASMVGVVGGVNPIVAAVAASVGSFLSVLLVVFFTSRARTAVVDRRTVRVEATVGAAGSMAEDGPAAVGGTPPAKPESRGRRRFKRWLVRFGVPGASLLGPLAIPPQLTSAILVAGGTPKGRVLCWQAVAIVLWTTIATISVWLALQVVVQV